MAPRAGFGVDRKFLSRLCVIRSSARDTPIDTPRSRALEIKRSYAAQVRLSLATIRVDFGFGLLMSSAHVLNPRGATLLCSSSSCLTMQA